MSRYIDADKYKQDLIQLGFLPALVVSVLDKQPTTDVIEVVHAHWIEHPHFNFEGGYSGANYECSNCHYDDLYDLDDINYCPKCGAKMDGERKE